MSTSKEMEAPASVAPEFVLFVHPNGRRATLCCTLRDVSLLVILMGRWAKLIILLEHARVEDQQIPKLPQALRGFRQAPDLARRCEENRAVDPPAATTITHYMSRLCRRLVRPDGDASQFPPLIERIKNTGARLLHPVKIIYLGDKP